MRIWIDNTGLHSAGSPLLGGNTNSFNLEGLYQIATILAFGDQIRMTSYPSVQVGVYFSRVLDTLSKIGVDENIISSAEVDPLRYSQICNRVADFCSKSFTVEFAPSTDKITGEFPVGLPDSATIHTLTEVTDILFCDDKAKLDETLSYAMEAPDSRAVIYMLCSNERLRQTVKETVVQWDGSWSVLRQIINYLRYQINEDLAAEFDCIYLPSVGRGRLVRQQNQSLALQLDLIFGDTRLPAIVNLGRSDIRVPRQVLRVLERAAV